MKKPSPLWAWSAILLLLVCLPRLSIDLYLPSLPAMADALHASDSQLQLTLSVFMAGSAASMLVCGPLAGSVFDAAFGWRAVFGLLCALGLLSLGLTLALVPETRPARVESKENVLALYRRLLGDAYFLRYALVFALTVSGYMVGSKLFQRWGAQQGAGRMLELAAGLTLADAAGRWRGSRPAPAPR